MNYSYLTYLSTSEYLPGLLATIKSLRNTGTTVPIAILISSDIFDEKMKKILETFNLNIIEISKDLAIPNNCIEINSKTDMKYWSNTFNKLKMFDLVHQGVDKFIYLDCDLLIRRNIDHLFASKALSAVVAGSKYPGNSGWVNFNSGLMVFEPNHEFYLTLVKKLQEYLAQDKPVGDQDILNDCLPNWSDNPSQMLSEQYNMFFNYSDYYCSELNFEANSIYVVHFIGKDKPWFSSRFKQYLKLLKYAFTGQFVKVKFYREYLKLIGG